jgi:leader peptidase (prepilin peptidase) / N-methyltransferase
MLGLEWVLAGVFGLLIGSFLNVVIHRTPKILERQWEAEAKAMLYPDQEQPEQAPYNLVVPRSACPHCGHVLTWYENIPVLSWLWLRGKCSACGAGIGLRYPVVELLVSIWFAYCAHRWGITLGALAWAVFGAALLAGAWIDWDTTLLPDDLTLPLLWLGLIAAALKLTGLPTLTDSIWGAVGGYLSLWSIYWAFKLLTGKEGMGYGDFKLFAALGAWFGWAALIPIILMASVIGALVGIAMKFNSSLREGGYVPFGPFLAGAGLVACIFGPQSVMRAVGL